MKKIINGTIIENIIQEFNNEMPTVCNKEIQKDINECYKRALDRYIPYLIEVFVKGTIEDCFDTLSFYPCNSDGEQIEYKYYEIVDEIAEVILEDKPTFVAPFIKEYLRNNYNYDD